MNIHEAIMTARTENKALRREGWVDCLYHGMDNVLRWHTLPRTISKPTVLYGTIFSFSIADLTATDWEVTDDFLYQKGFLTIVTGIFVAASLTISCLPRS